MNESVPRIIPKLQERLQEQQEKQKRLQQLESSFDEVCYFKNYLFFSFV